MAKEKPLGEFNPFEEGRREEASDLLRTEGLKREMQEINEKMSVAVSATQEVFSEMTKLEAQIQELQTALGEKETSGRNLDQEIIKQVDALVSMQKDLEAKYARYYESLKELSRTQKNLTREWETMHRLVTTRGGEA